MWAIIFLLKLLQNYKGQPKNHLGLDATNLIIFISKNAEKIPKNHNWFHVVFIVWNLKKKITLPFTLKSHVKAKERRKIYGNSNISPLQKL